MENERLLSDRSELSASLLDFEAVAKSEKKFLGLKHCDTANCPAGHCDNQGGQQAKCGVPT